jgi:hypothetical protein
MEGSQWPERANYAYEDDVSDMWTIDVNESEMRLPGHVT